MSKIEIKLSKKKLLLGIGGSILFIMAGVYLYTSLAEQQEMFNPVFIKVVGIIAIIFFSATAIYGIRKVFSKSIGLTIDETGLFDNTNYSSAGFIKWSDITAINTEEVASTRFLLIHIANPSDYINKATGFKKKLMKGNHKLYGTPVTITSNTLKCGFNELKKIINDKFKAYLASKKD